MSLDRQVILVTGAGGSVGTALIKWMIHSNVKQLRAFDVDEYSLSKLTREVNDLRVVTFLGDVKDSSDVERAMRGVDIVVHLAAVKMIDVSSYHPTPCIRTNIDGTINLVNVALKEKVEKFLYFSSDKAVDFASVYGATKFIGERLTLWANSFNRGKYSVCRFGNIYQTRGNVFEIWEEQKRKRQPITVTHPEMERYFIKMADVAQFVLKVIEVMKGGEVFIRKMSKSKVIDLAKAFSKNIEFVGVRPEERLDAKLYADYEEPFLKDEGDFWVIKH